MPLHRHYERAVVEDKIRVKPFHLFRHRGRRCLINIEEMSAHAVDAQVAARLAPLQAGSRDIPEPDTEKILKGLGLLGNGKPGPLKKPGRKPAPMSAWPFS